MVQYVLSTEVVDAVDRMAAFLYVAVLRVGVLKISDFVSEWGWSV